MSSIFFSDTEQISTFRQIIDRVHQNNLQALVKLRYLQLIKNSHMPENMNDTDMALQIQNSELNREIFEGYGFYIPFLDCLPTLDSTNLEPYTMDKIGPLKPQDLEHQPLNPEDLGYQYVRNDHLPKSHRQSKWKFFRGIQGIVYLTKNFLQAFKMPHLVFLRKQLGDLFVNTFQIIKQLSNKHGITLQDYERLYNIPQFRQALKKMLDKKILHRDLMIARSKTETKIVNNQALFNFDQAYQTKEFTKIAQTQSVSVSIK